MKRKTLRAQRISRALKRLWRDPRRRERLAEHMRRRWQNPAYRRRIVAATTGQWRSPATRRRMSRALKRLWRDPRHRRMMIRALKLGWQNPTRRARRVAIARRNFGPSIGARGLRNALGPGWFLEYWTDAGPVDVGHPDLRLAIEVDDVSHRRELVKRRDRRKTRRLRRLGWTVFRVSEAGCRAAFGGRPCR